MPRRGPAVHPSRSTARRAAMGTRPAARPAMPATLDHLVVAAADLAAGVAHVAARLGVTPAPGGRHALMGTHNALLGLGPGCYLEVIAVDPEAPPPDRPRWFGLDHARVRAALAARPRLLHWVARCHDLDAARDGLPWAAGTPLAMARGAYRWCIAVPDDGALPLDGVAPTLIRWDGEHPAASLADAGCRLARLELAHPESTTLGAALARLGLDVGVAYAPAPALRAEIVTPAGPRWLD